MRRYQPVIGLAMIAIGLLVLLLNPQNPDDRPRAIVLLVAGLIYLILAILQRLK